jgi:histone-binding protein RBBP4
VSEDNVVMVWQPTMRVWAGDEVKIDEKELEGDAMEGVESTNEVRTEKTTAGSRSVPGSGEGSLRSKSMSMSVSAGTGSVGDDDDV